MKRNAAIMICGLAFALVGCASAGTQVDPATVASFQKGVTTKAEIIAALGAPNGQADLGNGTTMVTYSYTHSQADAVTFVPIVGAFAGGATGETQTEMFMFDSHDVLTKVTKTSSQAHSRV